MNLLNRTANSNLEAVKLIFLWPCALIVPTTVFAVLGSFITGAYHEGKILIGFIQAGLTLQSCIFLLGAPFTILSFVMLILKTRDLMKNKGWNNSDFWEKFSENVLGASLFYAVTYFWYSIGVFLFNANNLWEWKLDLMDPISLTYFLVSYPFL